MQSEEIEIATVNLDDKHVFEQYTSAALLLRAPALFDACISALMELKKQPNADSGVLEELRDVLDKATSGLEWAPILSSNESIESYNVQQEVAATSRAPFGYDLK